MNYFQVYKKLQLYPTFNLDILAWILGKDKDYAKVYLNRLLKRNLVFKLQRNVYTIQEDPLIVASRIIWPSYISLWSALRYHNLTEQLPSEINVITTQMKSRRHIEYMETKIVFNHVKPIYFFGFNKIYVKGFEVFMGEAEKSLLDAILLKKISLTEMYSMIIENRENLSLEKLLSYTLRMKNKGLAKRIGWMLDSIGYREADRLLPLIYKTVIPLDYSKPTKGKKDEKWGVIVNI